jgi:hypothetical protein
MPELLAEIPANLLTSMISRTIFAISTEESRFTLNGALLLVKSDGLTMVATDGHRLAMVDTKVDLAGVGSNYRALLPRKAMSELLKLAGEASPEATIKFSGDENHLFFQLGERLLISRKLTGNFPDFERVLPKEQPNHVILKREELRDRGQRGRGADRFQEGAPRHVFRKHRPHHSRGDDALVALVLARLRLAAQRQRGMFVFSLADMLAAMAAPGTKTAIGIEWVIEGRHEASCADVAP